MDGSERDDPSASADRRLRVSVIGGSTVSEAEYDAAREVGRLLGERGHVLVCGGRGGAMEAACRGASGAGGPTVGILPGADPSAANPYVETPVATGMGAARNALVVLNGDAVIAVDGGAGTLSELGHALDLGRPVAGIDTHRLEGFDVEHVDRPAEAVGYVERAVRASR
jgi:uncharacterized protein (TIGR00725 family)